MPDTAYELEILWDALLSRIPERILEAYKVLKADEQMMVLTHLQRMVSEPGWLAEQRLSAKTALETLQAADTSPFKGKAP